MFCSTEITIFLCVCVVFFSSVDWWPSSCPDPSPERPDHQPRKPAMRNHLTTCSQTTVAEIWEDFTGHRVQAFTLFASLASWLSAITFFFFFNCCKTITTVVHVFHALIAWSLTEHTGRAGLLIRVVKETQRCIKGPLCLKYREAFSTFACFLFFFHLLERQEGRWGGAVKKCRGN